MRDDTGEQDPARQLVRNYKAGRTHPRVARSLPGVLDGVTRAVAVRAEEIVAFLVVFLLGLLLMPVWAAWLHPALTLLLLLAVPLGAATSLRLLHLEGRRAPQLLRGWAGLATARLLARHGTYRGRPWRPARPTRPGRAVLVLAAPAGPARGTRR